jgi:E3 ubiquitin-protein ligase HERC2
MCERTVQTSLLLSVKLQAVQAYVASAMLLAESGKDVYLDRARAAAHPREHALFLQAYRQLARVPVRRLQQEDQAWTVRLRGEGAQDAGGPYRESLALLGAELSTGVVPLLLPCANAREGHGDNREKCVPNPERRSAEDMSMFRFLGRVRPLAQDAGRAPGY